MGSGSASGPQAMLGPPGLYNPLGCCSLNERRQTSHTMWSSEVERAQSCGRGYLQGSEPTETHVVMMTPSSELPKEGTWCFRGEADQASSL